MIGKGAFIASKKFAKKHYTSAVKSIKELRGPIGKINTKAYKHVTKKSKKIYSWSYCCSKCWCL